MSKILKGLGVLLLLAAFGLTVSNLGNNSIVSAEPPPEAARFNQLFLQYKGRTIAISSSTHSYEAQLTGVFEDYLVLERKDTYHYVPLSSIIMFAPSKSKDGRIDLILH